MTPERNQFPEYIMQLSLSGRAKIILAGIDIVNSGLNQAEQYSALGLLSSMTQFEEGISAIRRTGISEVRLEFETREAIGREGLKGIQEKANGSNTFSRIMERADKIKDTVGSEEITTDHLFKALVIEADPIVQKILSKEKPYEELKATVNEQINEDKN